jgi:hypothetical protein
VLAEAVQLSGGFLVFLLVVALIAIAAVICLIVFGFTLAPKAARGSQGHLAFWIVVLTIEGLLGFWSLLALDTGPNLGALFWPVIIALQAWRFRRAKRDG